MKKLVTERDLESLAGKSFQVTAEMILTPSARDYASRNGVQLEYGESDRSAESAMDQAIREAVTAELGSADAQVLAAVKSAMGGPGGGGQGAVRHGSPASRAVRDAARPRDGEDRAVLSAMGENQMGILSTLTSAISELGGDIQNVSQTIVGGYFTMILIVDLGPLGERGVTFEQFRGRVLEAVKGLGLEGMLVHEDVLRAMHRV